MFNKKNSLSLLLLLITGAFAFGYLNHGRRGQQSGSGLSLPSQTPDEIRDSVAANSSHGAPSLTLPTDGGTELRDAVAAGPAFGPARSADVQQNGGQIAGPASPRGVHDFSGGGNGSHPGSELPQNHPAPQNVSPSGPPQL